VTCRRVQAAAKLTLQQSGADACATFYRDKRRLHELHGLLLSPSTSAAHPDEQPARQTQAQSEAHTVRVMMARLEAFEPLFMNTDAAARHAAAARRLPAPRAGMSAPRMLAAAEKAAVAQLARADGADGPLVPPSVPLPVASHRPPSWAVANDVPPLSPPSSPRAARGMPPPGPSPARGAVGAMSPRALGQCGPSASAAGQPASPPRHAPSTLPSADLAGGSAYRDMLREVTSLMRGCQAALRDAPQIVPPTEEVRAALAAQSDGPSESGAAGAGGAMPPAVAAPPPAPQHALIGAPSTSALEAAPVPATKLVAAPTAASAGPTAAGASAAGASAADHEAAEQRTFIVRALTAPPFGMDVTAADVGTRSAAERLELVNMVMAHVSASHRACSAS
jgi:hypothetical protein